MKAVTITEFGAQPTLRDDLPAPVPLGDEVLVRVHASSVNPLDGAIAGGKFRGMLHHQWPVALGRDFAGRVEQVGEDVSGVQEGDRVFGEIPFAAPIKQGAWAEFIVVRETALVRTPESVSEVAAGAAALCGSTALMIVHALDLSSGDTVLIAGATGGVGSLVVQLAASAGAIVIANGFPEDHEFLCALGVTEILSRDGDMVTALRRQYPDGVDAIVDLVNQRPGTFDACLKDGGRVASTTNSAGQGSGRTNVMHAAAPADILDRVARCLADRRLEVPIHRTYELADAGMALSDLVVRHTQGKLAVRVA